MQLKGREFCLQAGQSIKDRIQVFQIAAGAHPGKYHRGLFGYWQIGTFFNRCGNNDRTLFNGIGFMCQCCVSSQYAGSGPDGFLELKRGSIKRTTGSPTIKISGPGVLYEYDGTIADITCDGKLAYVDKSSSSTVITNNNNAECQ